MINKEEALFLFLFLGYGTKTYRNPFLNIMVSGKNITVAVLELVDFQRNLVDGGKR